LRLAAGRLRRTERLETRFAAAVEQEKLAALKELAYGASHEINNPLANISTRAQTLLRDETDPERRRKLATINAQAFRAHEMISDLMLFAKPPPLEKKRVNVPELIQQVLDELSEEAEDRAVELLQLPADPQLVAELDPVQMAVALRAVCRNALEAVSVSGRIEVMAGRVETPSGCAPQPRWIAITVQDDGPGIPQNVRRHLFDPYFSGREAGRGLGLGLSKCWRIVAEHGGAVEVGGEHRRGAKLTILLPHSPPGT
jgi:signal transduction histidine kinase